MHNMGEEYGMIVENINDLVSVVNLEFEYINEITHKNLIGYSSVELLGKKVSNFIHTDDRENFLSIFNNSIDIGIKFIEARIRHHDGHYLWIETNSKPFKDKHGKLKVIAISRVITERKNAEEKIKLKSRQWKTTFDALKEPIFILDLNQKIIQCNQATLKMFKKSSPDEIIGQSCYELVHCRSQPVDWCPVMRMIKTNRRESSFNQIDDKLVEVSADPIYDENNRLIGAVHLITDVTLKQLTEQKLKESEEKYHSLFDSFPHFIGIIDMKGILIDCNSAINKFISMHKKEDFIGLSFIQILSIIDKNKQN